MKTHFVSLIAVLLLFLLPDAAVQSSDSPAPVVVDSERTMYSIDPAHTTVGFRIRHMGIAFVEGEFDTFGGTVSYDPDDVVSTRADVTIQTTSIDTDVQQRDDHLRSADFFEVETWPVITFASTSVQPTSQNDFRLTGDLTIKGITTEVVLDVEAAGPIPVEGGQRVGFHASTTIDRRDFGITWGDDLPGGIPTVGHQVQLILDVEGISSE